MAFTVQDALLIPEGIAHDPVSGDFFVGSTYQRKVVRVTPDGSTSDFVSTASDGLWGIVGMRVDVDRRILWLASSHAGDGMPMIDMVSQDEGSSGLFGYDIETGQLVHRHVLADGSHFLNDVAVTNSGVVYVTDSQTGWVYRFDPVTSVFDAFVDLSSSGANGIDLSPDDETLFVAVGRAIVRVELSTRSLSVVLDAEQGPGVIDGLYFHNGYLLGIAPFGNDVQVARFGLRDGDTTVVEVDSLLGQHPLLEQPTTGAVVGDTLFLVANSHLQTFRGVWSAVRLDTTGVGLRDVTVLRIPLRRP